ncbi:MAG: vitamin K epoxide reductase family protein [Candidatus Binatia bacterium]
MAKAARKKKSERRAPKQISLPAASPNWLVLGLAVLGMALTAYLTISMWRGEAVVACTAGSGCDIVLNSRWSKLFGLPTSFWGFVTYASLAGAAFLKRADSRWRLIWVISLFGVLYSIYLTGVSFIQLDSACPYCLTSLALFVAVLAVTLYQRPENLPRFEWRPWLLKTAGAGLLAVAVLHLHYAGILGRPAQEETPRLRALAEHLTKTEAKFYGAFWCRHCQDQKEIFGPSAHRLPYIECTPAGQRGPMAAECVAANVTSFPTWIINGRRYQGTLTSTELADHSGFKEKPAAGS